MYITIEYCCNTVTLFIFIIARHELENCNTLLFTLLNFFCKEILNLTYKNQFFNIYKKISNENFDSLYFLLNLNFYCLLCLYTEDINLEQRRRAARRCGNNNGVPTGETVLQGVHGT